MVLSETYDGLAERVSRAGLVARGGFHPTSLDDVPLMPGGRPVGTVVMVGHVGRSMWPAFVASGYLSHDAAHPLDDWSRAVLTEIAAEVGAGVVMASDGPPHAPIQRWAMRSESVHSSPLGLLIHPEFGLWHGWRGALLLADRWALPARGEAPSPCETCADRPCLGACPVSAFSAEGYDVPRCRAHLTLPDGERCLTAGCLARAACPVGGGHAYLEAQTRFHMAAFQGGAI